jgi:hypothetical protein
MILRWLATAAIALLFVLDLALPSTPIGRRGNEAQVRSDISSAAVRVGETLPDFSMQDLSGQLVRSSDLRGHRVLLTFERSVDW